MANTVKLGTLYVDGRPQKADEQVTKDWFKIGDTSSVYPLTWVKCNNLLVSDHNVVNNVSWGRLNGMGFIRGKPIKIDGNYYLCRSLKVGVKDGQPNEWDTILNLTDDSNETWHWKSRYFWGQEFSPAKSEPGKMNSRMVRGFKSARFRKEFSRSIFTPGIGFRPVLEPIAPLSDMEAKIGYNVTVHAVNGAINGRLCEISDYDIVLTGTFNESLVKHLGPWVNFINEHKLVIDREYIVCVY